MDIVGRVTLSASGMVDRGSAPGRLAIILIGPFCGLVFAFVQSISRGVPRLGDRWRGRPCGDGVHPPADGVQPL